MKVQTQAQTPNSQVFFLVEIMEDCGISIIKKSSNKDKLEEEVEKLREEAKKKYGRYAIYVEYKIMVEEEYKKLEKECEEWLKENDVDVNEDDEDDWKWWEEEDEEFDPELDYQASLDEKWARTFGFYSAGL